MNKENMLYVVIALLVGILGTVLVLGVANKSKEPAAPVGNAMPATSPAEVQQRITEAEKIVAQDPKNVQAWVQLGNDYFDTNQPQKAISAYGKALELQPNNPNVLTDQGVMYKNVGWYDKAIANFEKAAQIDPKHVQSLFNIGIVYATDLNQPDKAIAAWNRFLAVDSSSPQAQQIRGMIEQLKSGGGLK
ncbi:tetratricopeptide repeat protein [Geobacter sp. DSM 9736]|uniref:tetratricopeptide repeat protein n=1 Tax=Geobacter sp. DSM 9736 TaxID=1277350 RepID=UPI000B5021C6|nr:tetratricopeptide repeat protein [Geobacter sp. DSM 9736]SNB44829.1 Tetratricopeptide repeat-containing protein [Geobacter sp. DSM 9736]